MLKKIFLAILILCLLLLFLLEIAIPHLIRFYIREELAKIGIEDFQMSITSPRPYIFSFLKGNLTGNIVIEQYSTDLTFERLMITFSNLGFNSGDFSFSGIISEQELDYYIKNNWGKELDIVLSEGQGSISLPINLIFMTLEASIKGVFQVKANNEVVFEVQGVIINLPGFEQQVIELLKGYEFRLDFGQITNIQIENIDIKEGYLNVSGKIVR
ncbi:hypothetical protein SAMN02745227_01407 [Anaerobranca californiensis DSM 14826]|jgi:hypothetical protein|uniref:Uncharacterized protein n=1 Tax=Anaerobranca californiensis DSM 14826 TaxID=1120989 RepID=A0A1M6PD07_9FIRM|nr:hypothetical protein [Anaerobranca californiensis]SHK05770.1 hypothetical protein SAMN02745227_01407 [Anaerobranca californiensis DSM 14826]